MSKHNKSEHSNLKEISRNQLHHTVAPRLEGKVKNVGIKPVKKEKKQKPED